MIEVKQPPDPWQRTTTEHGFRRRRGDLGAAKIDPPRPGRKRAAARLGDVRHQRRDGGEAVVAARRDRGRGCRLRQSAGAGAGRNAVPACTSATRGRSTTASCSPRMRSASGDRAPRTAPPTTWSTGRSTPSPSARRLPEIPDFALDMHTRRGEEMGRDYRFFMEEASRVVPEGENSDHIWRDWIIAALDEGKLT